MHATLALAIIAGLFHGIGYVQYARKIIAGTSRPNLASWTLWVALAVLNGVSYFVMSGDVVKSLLSLVSALGCMMVWCLALRLGRFSRLDRIDWVAMVIGAVAMITWWTLRSATIANLLLQSCFLISIVPTYRSVWKNPHGEQLSPWLLWTIAYALATLVVVLRYQGHGADLAYPMISLISTAGVTALTLRGQ